MTSELNVLADAICNLRLAYLEHFQPVIDLMQKYARLKDAARTLLVATDVGVGHIHLDESKCRVCNAREELVTILGELE